MEELDYPAGSRRSRNERWLWLNVAVAVAALVLLVVFDVGLYLRFLALGAIGVIGFAVGLPLLGWWIFKNRDEESARVVWATFAALVLLGIGVAALFDARELQYHNCWVLNRQEDGSSRFMTWECVPGSAPEQGEWYSEATGSGGYSSCEFLNETSSGGTIWRCEYGDI